MNTGNNPSEEEKRKHAGSTLRIALGIGFLFLGVIGALLPVLQGWLFFLLAAVMFFPNHPRVERLMQRSEPKFPRLVGWLRRLGVGTTEAPEIARVDVGEWIHEHHLDELIHRPGHQQGDPPRSDEVAAPRDREGTLSPERAAAESFDADEHGRRL